MKWAVAIALLAVEPVIAAVPPPLPNARASQIFSPLFFSFRDDGESVFTSDGPYCLQYKVVNDFEQIAWPQHGQVAIAGFPQFVSEMQTVSGLQYIGTHGETGWLVVEVFANQTDAQNQLNIYAHNGRQWAPSLANPTEARISVDFPEGPAIEVSAGYIARILSAEHDVIYNEACYSFSLRGAFAAPQVSGYLGYADLCPIHTGDANSIFDGMSGVFTSQSYGGAYQNFSLQQALNATPQNRGVRSFQPNTNTAGDTRLYNAPRIVFAQVTQDVNVDGSYSNSLYNYPPGAQFAGAYPYGSGVADYPGQAGTSGFAQSGTILINLRFSEPMNPSYGGFAIQFQFSDGTVQDLTNLGKWRSNALPNDSWSATVNLPNNPPRGKVILAVRAQKTFCGAGQDVNNQDLDTTGSGSSPQGNIDTSIRFPIGRVPLLVEERGEAVFGRGAFGGLKFSERGLLYRQALRADVGEGAASDSIDTRFFRPDIQSAGSVVFLCAQPRLSGQKQRFYRPLAAAKRRLAKPSAYRPKGGKPTVCSPGPEFESYSGGPCGFERFASRRRALAGLDVRKVMSSARILRASPLRTRTYNLPVYIECPRRIRTWESRVAEGTGTRDLRVHSPGLVGGARASTRGTARGCFAGSSARWTTSAARREIFGYAVAWLRQAGYRRALLARLENVFLILPGSGSLARACARGVLLSDRGVSNV